MISGSLLAMAAGLKEVLITSILVALSFVAHFIFSIPTMQIVAVENRNIKLRHRAFILFAILWAIFCVSLVIWDS